MPTSNYSQALFNTLGEAIIALDKYLKIVAINPSTESLYGVTTAWALGKSLTELIGEDVTDAQAIQNGWAVVLRGETWRGTVWHITPTGRRFRAELSVRGFFKDGGEFESLVAVVRDVTFVEAARAREAVLSNTLRAIAEANTPEAVEIAALEGLMRENGADAVVLRSLSNDQFVLQAWRGIDLSILNLDQNAVLMPNRALALARGEVDIINLEHHVEPWTKSFFDAGFHHLESVGQRFGGQLIGTLSLLYRKSPEVSFASVLPQLGTALGTQLVQAQQRADLERRNDLLEILNQINQFMLENTNIIVMFNALAKQLQDLFRVPQVSIGLIHPKTISWLARAGQSNDVNWDTLSDIAPGLLTGQNTRRQKQEGFELYVPLHFENGTLLFELAGRKADFDTQHERDAMIIITQFARAFHHLHEREHIDRERLSLEALVEATRIFRTANTEAELNQIAVRYVLSVTRADTACVLLLDRDGLLCVVAASGLDANWQLGSSFVQDEKMNWMRSLFTTAQNLSFKVTTPTELVETSIGAPIYITDADGQNTHIIGILRGEVKTRSFDTNDRTRLTAVAEALGNARVRINALENSQERARAFERLAELSSALEKLDDPKEIAQAGLHALLDLTGFTAGIYAVVENGNINVIHMDGVSLRALSQLKTAFEIDANSGLFGMATKSRKPLIIADYQHHAQKIDAFTQVGLENIVLAPVFRDHLIHGFLGVGSLESSKVLPQNAAEVAEFLTGRLSRALERAEQIHEITISETTATQALDEAEERAQAFTHLASLSAELESLDAPRVIAGRGLETLLKLTGLDGALYAEITNGHVRILEQRGSVPEKALEWYDGNPVDEWVDRGLRDALSQPEPLIIEDYRLRSSAVSGFQELDIATFVLTSVRIQGKPQAIIAAASFGQVKALPTGITEFVQFLAGRISRALERVEHISTILQSEATALQALEQAEERAQAFIELAELSARLEALDELRAIAGDGLETLLKLTGLDSAVYYEISNDRLQAIEIRGTFPPEFSTLREDLQISMTNGFFSDISRNAQTVIINDYQDYPNAIPEFVTVGLRTGLIAPVHFDSRARGFICAASFHETRILPSGTEKVVAFISGRISRALERADQIAEILATQAASFQALSRTLEARDFETKGHTDRVTNLSLELGQELHLDKQHLQFLEWGAYLHDIGKVAIPDAVLLKPGSLTADEWLVIKEHPVIGYRILEDLHFLPLETLQVVRYHQERTDGSGYPDGLYGPEIPYLARLFAVVDVYDALISTRPYKIPWTHAAAISELQRQSGKTLDSEIVTAFLMILKRQHSKGVEQSNTPVSHQEVTTLNKTDKLV